MRRIQFGWLLIGLIFTPSLFAQPAVKRAITIDDYFTQADLFGVAYSPQFIAYVEGRWQESTEDRKTDLWIVPTGGQDKARRLTSDRASDRAPQFSPNGGLV